MNNQISNNTVLKTQIDSRPKRAKRFRWKRERKSSKRESESSSSDNPTPLITNPINRRSRISMSYHIPCLLRCLHPGFLWSLDGERDRRIVRWREIGFRLHHRYRVASPPSLAENSARWPGFEAGGERGAWSKGCERVSTLPPPQIFTGYELGNRLAAAITGQIWYKRAGHRLIVSYLASCDFLNY